MKTLLSSIFLLLCFNFSNAQFTLEHTFGDASTFNTNTTQSQLLIVNLEVDGYRFVVINRLIGDIEVYDMNYNLLKTMTPPNNWLVQKDSGYSSILYISQNLFSTDGKIDYMLVGNENYGNNPSYVTYVFDEDGNQLFYQRNQAPLVVPNYEEQQWPIYNTPNGTKMLLSSTIVDVDSAYVYGLPGSLTSIPRSDKTTIDNNIFPNPSSFQSTIEFDLDQSNLPATLKIFDLSGHLIATDNINTTDGHVSINSANLAAGLYYYSITTPQQVIPGKKFAVMH